MGNFFREQYNRYNPKPGDVSTLEHQHEAAGHAAELLEKLISFDTTTSTNPTIAQSTIAASEHVGEYMKELGAEIHYSEPYEFPAGSGKKHTSMLAVFKPTDPNKKNNKAYVYSAHIDTVPALEKWDGHSPHEAQVTEQRITGRGAIDLKGPAACVIGSIRALKESGKLENLQRPLVFALSSCEEVGLVGAKDISQLMRDHKIVPEDIMVVEPSESYVGTGNKGGIQEVISFKNSEPAASHTPWKNGYELSIQSTSGHSSLQGGSPADPAFVASKIVLPMVEKLRAKGIPIEITSIDYGKAGNVVGGEMKLHIGFGGTAQQMAEVKKYVEDGLKSFKNKSNLILSLLSAGVNFVEVWRQEVEGIDFGSMDLKVRPAPHPEQSMNTLTNGQSQGAAEAALRTAAEVYAINKEQRNNPGKGYIIRTLGSTKASSTMLSATADHAEMSYDLRYPVEGIKGTDRIPSASSLTDRIHDVAGKQPGFTSDIQRLIDFKPFVTKASASKIKSVADAARDVGLLHFKTDVTNVPNGSDANIFAEEFPNADILNVSGGGFSQNVHGVDEHITTEQLQKNCAFYMENIYRSSVLCQSQGVGV